MRLTWPEVSARRLARNHLTSPAEAVLAELVRRFLHAYGPAISAQFARWLGSPPSWTAALLGRLPDLETVDFDGAAALVNQAI